MNESLRVHLAPDTTCAEVVARAARYWELHPEDFYLCAATAVWTRTACAVDVLIQYDDEPEVTPELLLKPRPKIAKPHSSVYDASTGRWTTTCRSRRRCASSSWRSCALSDLSDYMHSDEAPRPGCSATSPSATSGPRWRQGSSRRSYSR